MIRCEPDKVRFSDPEATTNHYIIHTLDVSDERSTGHFISLWFKGKSDRITHIEQWKNERGLDDHHLRDLYHRDPPWIPATYPGKESEGWSHHSHVDYDRPPVASDLGPFAADLPPVILQEFREWLATR